MNVHRKTADSIQAHIKNAAKEIGDGLEKFRTQIHDLKTQRDDITEACVSEDIACARVDKFIGELSHRARQYVPDVETFTSVRGRGWAFEGSITDVLILYLGDVIAKNLKDDISTFYATTAGLDDASRANRLAEIDKAILAIELEEEATLRSAEEIGLKIPRRADADPRAVLAHDEVLAR